MSTPLLTLSTLFGRLRHLAWLLPVLLLLSACNSEPDFVKQSREREEAQKKADDATIQAYLAKRNITNFTRTESGLYLVRRVAGNGPEALNGKIATVKYIGRFLDDNGTRFDSSYDNNSTCGCFSVTVGAGQVIKGWDQALPLMRKGDEVTLFIPSYLAYGTGGSGAIPPNTPIMFEMIIEDVM